MIFYKKLASGPVMRSQSKKLKVAQAEHEKAQAKYKEAKRRIIDLECACAFDKKYKPGDDPIIAAVELGDLEFLKRVVQRVGEKYWVGGKYYDKSKSDHEKYQKFIASKAPHKAAFPILQGTTPLHIAAQRGDKAMVEFLVEDFRMDPELVVLQLDTSKNSTALPSETTPIEVAREEGHDHVERYLMSRCSL